MLAFEFDNGKLSKLSIVGGLQDIAAETTCMLYVIYSTIKKKQQKSRRNIQRMFGDGY